ncbi:hypothetical protein sos41_29930 [Alphaproteobacteria bacterium SO-S41]|nr:hypothetical protein sos41_29930 [Alphaproteobacteria bacterium SO-S41]
MRCFGALIFVASTLLAVAAPPARAQEVRWDVWVDTQNCSDTRATWLAVAKQHPGFGWSQMPGAPTASLFMEAIANMDALRISGPFQNYCCKFVLWRDNASGIQALVRENDVGGIGWVPDSVPMCAETAILQSGIADPIGALDLPLGSVPGASVVVTSGGIVPAGTAAISIPTNPPTVVAPSASPEVADTIGDITGETGGPQPPEGGPLPAGVMARVQGTFTLTCTRVDMAGWTAQGAMTLDMPDNNGAIGQGKVSLDGGELGQLEFTMQTQAIAGDIGALGVVEDPGRGVSRVEIQAIGKFGGAPSGVTPASGEIKVSIGMKSRFANGRTPGDGSCTGTFAT